VNRIFLSACAGPTRTVNSHPANYGRWLSAIVEQTRRIREPEERIVFVNAWNEWGEGCHLEPDQAFGHAFLEATRDALARATVTVR
jgi:lipopolysaccharide biosynthesis protein